MPQVNPLYAQIGARIRNVRLQWMFSKHTAANYLGIKLAVLERIEAGEESVSLDRLYRIAEVFHCPVYDLLPESRPMVQADGTSQHTDVRMR